LKLGDCAFIRTGLVFSRKEMPPDESDHVYRALSLKNVTDDGQILLSGLENYYTSETLKKEYFTRYGDVLLRLSAPYTTVLVTDEYANLLVPAHFAIIRAKKTLAPHYLYWWLTKSKKRFYQMASGGTMMGTISSGYVADMPFEPPLIERQRQMAKLLELAKREQQLLSELSKRKKRLSDAILAKIANENEKER